MAKRKKLFELDPDMDELPVLGKKRKPKKMRMDLPKIAAPKLKIAKRKKK
jgi:hypothetical protein